MEPTINALVLIGICLASVALLTLVPLRRITIGNVLVSTICVALTFMLVYVMLPLRVHEGSSSIWWTFSQQNDTALFPYRQIIIPLVCIVFILSLVRSNAVRYTASLVVMVSALLLGYQYANIVQFSPRYTSNPASLTRVTVTREKQVSKLLLAAYGEQPDANKISFPASALLQSKLLLALPEKERNGLTMQLESLQSYPSSVEIKQAWYTPLTGIYRYDVYPTYMWYPGGHLNQGLTMVKFHRAGKS